MGRNAKFVVPNGMTEQEASSGVSQLRELALELRGQYFPPSTSDGLVSIDTDLPIWAGDKDAVKKYHMRYKEAFDLAYKYYPQAALQKDMVIPAKIALPQFRYDVTRLSISKNKAKESLSFGSVGAVVAKCGEFSERDMARMSDFFQRDPLGTLVCHREFIDFRARMHTFNVKSNKHDKKSFITQFYTTGLIVAAYDVENFQVIDNRLRKMKAYSNAYTNPIAENELWKVYPKKTVKAKKSKS